MDTTNTNFSFPEYPAKKYTILGSSPEIILTDWKNYLNEIQPFIKEKETTDILKEITFIIDDLISFYNNSKYILPSHIIIYTNKSLELLGQSYNSKSENKIENILYKILENLLSLKNIIHLNNLENTNNNTENTLKEIQTNLKSSQAILQLSNLEGLASSFEYQYRQYNSERKFWGLIIFIILLTLIGRTVHITFHFLDIKILMFYIFTALPIFSWINPDFINSFFNFYTNKKLVSENKVQKRVNVMQFIVIIMSIEISIILYYLLFSTNFKNENLKFFSATLYNFHYNSIYDLLPTLFLCIPLICALWFSIKQYHYSTKIMNAYKFKMALSLAYNGYKEECEKLDKNNKESYEMLIKEIIHVISEDPSKRDFTDTNMPWSELKDIANIFKKK